MRPAPSALCQGLTPACPAQQAPTAQRPPRWSPPPAPKVTSALRAPGRWGPAPRVRGRGPAPETGLVAPQREVRGGCRGSHWGQCQRPPFTPFVAIRLSLPAHLSSQWVPRRRGCTCHGGETQVWDLGRLGQSQPPLEGAAVPWQSLCVRKARPVTRTSPTPGGRLPVL